ncbi:MAG: gliding motility-associated C-terminal domain-containing protein [Lewinellaceae bacterium]|nr:gliding motility-associated C-terminal domain-containing protein [Lewinellaceae bacterium]
MTQTKTILLAALCCLFVPATLHAQCPTSGNTVQVINNSGNNVNGSLSWAIGCLNTVPSLTTVTFNIPGSTVIQPSSMPNVGKTGALIDGNSQSGIIIDGASPAGAPTNCFVLTAANCTVQGLTIRNFTSPSGGNAIQVIGNNPTIQNNTLIANRIGVTTSTTVFSFNITNNTIGESGAGNTVGGVSIQGSPSAGVISFNEIAHNGGAGISIIGGTVRIQENSLYCNTTSGIARPTPPALPVITQATTQQIRGTATANALVEVFIHSTAGCAGVPCQGRTLVGTATALASGIWTLPVPGGVPAGSIVTATSTISGNNTSAFSTCANVVDCSAFVAGINQTNVTCPGGNNGTAMALPTGSTLTYSWSTGGNTQNISNLAAGTYTVTVTNNATGCTDSESATITQPGPLSLSFSNTNVSCFGGNNGTANASANGGTPGYNFVWSTGFTGPALNNLAAGTYTVTVSDANGCTTAQATTITQPPVLSVAISKLNATCFGGNNGTATATGNGGTPGYNFSWSNGAAGPVATNLVAGAYTVTVSDANGCTATQTTTITQPPPLGAGATATDVTCFGGANGTASATGSGGVTPYTIAWSNGATGPIATNLAAGTYTATVTDANACTAEASATVDSPPPLDVSVSATDETANNANDGTAAATPSGGTPGYLYTWSNGGNSASISNLPPGAYTVTVRDANNCTAVATAVVNAFACAGFSAGVTDNHVTCNGLADGSATAGPGGGTSPYAYLWNTGATAQTISNLAPGNYTVTVTDASNCTTIGFAAISQPAALALNVSATDAGMGLSNGTATAAPSGGTPGYLYAWSTGGATAQIGGLAPGVYTVVVHDANGCSITGAATVGSSGSGGGPCISLPAYALYVPAQVCGNDPFNLTVDDLYAAAAVQYRWILPTGDTLVSTVQSINLVATSTAFSGQYFVVRDSAGCRSVPVGGAPLTVLSLPPGAAFAGTDTVSCAAGVAVLRATPLVQGTGQWISPSGAKVDNPVLNPTSARDLKPGANVFVWQVGLGGCDQAAADTVVYFWETPPTAGDDMYTIERAQDVAVMEVLLNDALGGMQDTVVTQIGTPAAGTLEYLPETRRFRYTAEEGYRGTVQFRYVVCNPNSVCGFGCDTALVTIRVLNLPSVPEALVVDDPGPNGQLQIRGIGGFSRVEIGITDRWGDLVFEEKTYNNDNPWLGDFKRSGKALPGGAYYYFLNAYDGDQRVGGTQVGVIHLFDNER